MYYRVYDKKEKRWINEVFMFPNGSLFILKKKLFGHDKITMLKGSRYVIHRNTLLVDKGCNVIYEGDICKGIAEEGFEHIHGVVAYSREVGMYCIFDEENSKFYPMVEQLCENVEIVGNVFDMEYKA